MDNREQGLDIKFVKKEVLYLINIRGRLAMKELKQSLNNSDVSRYLTLCQGLIPVSSTLIQYLVYLA